MRHALVAQRERVEFIARIDAEEFDATGHIVGELRLNSLDVKAPGLQPRFRYAIPGGEPVAHQPPGTRPRQPKPEIPQMGPHSLNIGAEDETADVIDRAVRGHGLDHLKWSVHGQGIGHGIGVTPGPQIVTDFPDSPPVITGDAGRGSDSPT
ncbi:hypothetical protein ACFOY4_39965 [Actinomadura syzygii]|uniref:hypothetical protein n=1 Tax=Actinomadura syzygii TaxID=1427538 RepID=UPI001651F35F|nr:hypothetical protein [Actinomadura syzygii]